MIAMINTREFGQAMKKRGFHFYSGVPCSFLKDLINYAINDCKYVGAANEGDAVAISSGAYLSGKKAVVLMQNSGLTNAISPLSSLNHPFQIPLLGFVGFRGEASLSDEPQHELMGKITTSMLDLLEIKWEYLSSDWNHAQEQLDRADREINNNHSFFFIVRKGTFMEEPLRRSTKRWNQNQLMYSKRTKDEIPTRYEALEAMNQLKDHKSVLLATTGKTGRELYEIEDSRQHFYMVGSMGCVSSLGLGIAMQKKDRRVIAIDGDGSMLMRLGSLATIGYYHPYNLLHILLDNGSHDSTGGQSTVSEQINFIQVAAACGYARSIYVHNLDELKTYINEWKDNQELTFLYLKISQGSKKGLGRPKMKPWGVKERLKGFLDDNG